jgi:uncharacterized LabA/DUF88 family protein
MNRVIAYIDGFNLYFGLRSKGWKYFYWLNLQAVAQNMLKPGQKLEITKYFTAKVSFPSDKQRRQNTFLEALGTLSNFHIYYGHYLDKVITCRNCGATWHKPEEKMTDVNIAMELLTDTFQNAYDTALLFSADSDLVGPIKKVKLLFPHKHVVVVFPPGRHSAALKRITAHTFLGRNVLLKSVFPDEVVKPDGFILHRPVRWH